MQNQILCLFLMVVVAYAGNRDCTWMEKRLTDNLKKSSVYSSDFTETITRIYPYTVDLELLVNHQIKMELNAFYNYLSMSHFFRREDQDMDGFTKFFHDAAMEELKHAEMFMKYQAKRGGRVELYNLPAPSKQEWNNALHVLRAALALERNVTDEVLCLHQMSNDKYNDVDLTNFLEGEIIPEQYTGMKELASKIKTLTRMASSKSSKGKEDFKNYGMAEFHFDQLLKESK